LRVAAARDETDRTGRSHVIHRKKKPTPAEEQNESNKFKEYSITIRGLLIIQQLVLEKAPDTTPASFHFHFFLILSCPHDT
jgi:hypothetical protein